MINILCTVNDSKVTSEALTELISLGITNHYFLEDHSKNLTQIGGCVKVVPLQLKHSSLQVLDSEIDWKEQSKAHSSYYLEGQIKVDLTKFCKNPKKNTFELKPGPGFGDISHETTQLMLSSIGDYVQDKHVLDIGAGNGILSIASYFMGAKKVTALEIDDAALAHAKENCHLNNLSSSHIELKKRLSSQDTPLRFDVLLMNMTLQEQLFIIKNNFNLLSSCKVFISSGILTSQIPQYKKIILQTPLNFMHIKNFNNWNSLIYTN